MALPAAGLSVLPLLLGALLQFDVKHLGFDLVLEFVAGALELGEEFAQLAGDFGQLFGPTMTGPEAR